MGLGYALCCLSAVALSQCGAVACRGPWATSHVRLSAGVLLDVQKFFRISDSSAGLLQTGKEGVLARGWGRGSGRAGALWRVLLGAQP